MNDPSNVIVTGWPLVYPEPGLVMITPVTVPLEPLLRTATPVAGTPTAGKEITQSVLKVEEFLPIAGKQFESPPEPLEQVVETEYPWAVRPAGSDGWCRASYWMVQDSGLDPAGHTYFCDFAPTNMAMTASKAAVDLLI